ncbi:glutaminyl-peptide cyclotransferase-like isoform X2 [Prosopis cineraria]|uniref:glutaminyl-peptide cyclotransferase-like isoform X2 n=1 Tax=Prosopis cineraria TaxID=364024 RepID=UPI00240EFE29|nr:glutaminyl-peptide cyclotransferase-like isoform X2 [Prosopis cineraria]
MASLWRKTGAYTTLSLLLSASLAIAVIDHLAIPTKKLSDFKYGESYSYEMVSVINEFPHDPEAFTQGLVYGGNDTLFESTGLYGKSSVRKVALRTGKVETLQKIDDSIFGEGLTLFGERLFQVAWLQKTGFIYDHNNLSKVGEFMHQMNDGWGLATDGEVLFGSDGSSTLYQMDPRTFNILSKSVVYYKGHQVKFLNELESVNGEVWANVLGVDCIVRISPKDGRVIGWIVLPNLREQEVVAQNQMVLNGIAWDSEKKRIFVTGKLWSKIYEIRVVPINKPIEEGFIEQLCLPPLHKFTYDRSESLSISH